MFIFVSFFSDLNFDFTGAKFSFIQIRLAVLTKCRSPRDDMFCDY